MSTWLWIFVPEATYDGNEECFSGANIESSSMVPIFWEMQSCLANRGRLVFLTSVNSTVSTVKTGPALESYVFKSLEYDETGCEEGT